MLTKNHDTLTVEVQKHLDADALIKGKYWTDAGKGCFIGCLAHSSDPGVIADKYGIPVTVTRIAEDIYEALPDKEDRRKFFADLPVAVERNEKDLTRVHWQFLAAELRALPEQSAEIQAVIDPVISGMDLLASGKQWPDAADAAAYAADAAVYAEYAADAADAADAAADAAAYAAYAAVYAADAAVYAVSAASAAAYADYDAYDAARKRQRETLLRLISQAT